MSIDPMYFSVAADSRPFKAANPFPFMLSDHQIFPVEYSPLQL